jgi:hypothetical protein
LVYASSHEIMARFDTFSLDGRAEFISTSCLKICEFQHTRSS